MIIWKYYFLWEEVDFFNFNFKLLGVIKNEKDFFDFFRIKFNIR